MSTDESQEPLEATPADDHLATKRDLKRADKIAAARSLGIPSKGSDGTLIFQVSAPSGSEAASTFFRAKTTLGTTMSLRNIDTPHTAWNDRFLPDSHDSLPRFSITAQAKSPDRMIQLLRKLQSQSNEI